MCVGLFLWAVLGPEDSPGFHLSGVVSWLPGQSQGVQFLELEVELKGRPW